MRPRETRFIDLDVEENAKEDVADDIENSEEQDVVDDGTGGYPIFNVQSLAKSDRTDGNDKLEDSVDISDDDVPAAHSNPPPLLRKLNCMEEIPEQVSLAAGLAIPHRVNTATNATLATTATLVTRGQRVRAKKGATSNVLA